MTEKINEGNMHKSSTENFHVIYIDTALKEMECNSHSLSVGSAL